MPGPALLFLLTIALGYVPRKTRSAANDHLHQAAVEQLCTFSLKAKKAAARVEKKLSDVKNSISSLVLTSKRLHTFGVKNPQWAEAAFILELHFDKLRDATLGDLATKVGAAVKLSAQAAYAAGRIDETTSMFVRAKHSSAPATALCVSNGNANTAMEEGKDSGCAATDVTALAADETDLAAAAAVFKKETTIKGGTASTACKLTQGVSNAFDQGSGDFELVGGLITLAAAGGFKNDKYAKTAAEVAFLQPLTQGGKETHSYLSTNDDLQTVTPTTIKNMLNKANTAGTLADAINAFYQYERPKSADELRPIVKYLFKVAEIDGNVGFATALEGDKVAVKPKGSEELENTMELNSKQLTREEVQALKKVYQKASKKAPDCSKELSDASEAYKKKKLATNKRKLLHVTQILYAVIRQQKAKKTKNVNLMQQKPQQMAFLHHKLKLEKLKKQQRNAGIRKRMSAKMAANGKAKHARIQVFL
uniref:Variant surface glycoprotein n=1 Tax=Trypanosoma brucei TaxID=5691 RepID=A0A1V0FYT3_9TRYP|nr:variant surface glycoprotein [Trypanosoma brucei]